MSFNCRGFASAPKKLALKALINSYKPNVLLLQETLGYGEEISRSLHKMFHGWDFQSMYAKGRSKGLATGMKEGRLNVFST